MWPCGGNGGPSLTKQRPEQTAITTRFIQPAILIL